MNVGLRVCGRVSIDPPDTPEGVQQERERKRSIEPGRTVFTWHEGKAGFYTSTSVTVGKRGASSKSKSTNANDVVRQLKCVLPAWQRQHAHPTRRAESGGKKAKLSVKYCGKHPGPNKAQLPVKKYCSHLKPCLLRVEVVLDEPLELLQHQVLRLLVPVRSLPFARGRKHRNHELPISNGMQQKQAELTPVRQRPLFFPADT